MLKLVEIPAIARQQNADQPRPTDGANNVFRVLHGFYGNLFLSKFATGEPLPGGGDGGVASARGIWAYGLRQFTTETVKAALGRTVDTHPEFPPTLPQFVALCKACAPRQAFQPALPPAAVDRTEHARKARERLESIRATQPKEDGLTLLKQAIAEAVGCAGGDEAATLARLDRMLAPTRQAVAV